MKLFLPGLFGLTLTLSINSFAPHPVAAAPQLYAQSPEALATQNSLIRQLYQASKTGDLAKIRALIAQGVNINSELSNEVYRPIIYAVHSGNLEWVKLLVEHGAEINARYNDGNSLLQEAIRKGHVQIVKYLLEQGASVQHQNFIQSTPLNTAANDGNAEIMHLLLAHGARVDTVDEWGGTPLEKIAEKGDTELLQTLLKQPNMNPKQAVLALAKIGDGQGIKSYLAQNGDKTVSAIGNPLLLAAAMGGNVSLFNELVKTYNLDPTYSDADGNTALHYAARKGHIALVNDLLQNHGLDINQPHKYGNTPLIDAVREKQAAMVQHLLKKGADPNAAPEYRSALMWAVAHGDQALVKTLIAFGADIHLASPLPPLLTAVGENQVAMVKFLLDQGANPNQAAASDSPVSLAVRNSNLTLVKYLVERGADPNQTLEIGMVPLEFVAGDKGHAVLKYLSQLEEIDLQQALLANVYMGDLETIKALVARGADPRIETDPENNSLNIALRHGRFEVVRYLMETHHLKPHLPEDLFTALRQRNLSLIKYLVSQGVNIHLRDNQQRTALHQAAAHGPFELIQYLVEQGAAPLAIDEEGNTPLSEAIKSGQLAEVRYLVQQIGGLQPDRDKALLLNAIASEQPAVVAFVLQQGLPAHQINEAGETPLHLAISQQNFPMVKALLARGARINNKNLAGESPLFRAVQKGGIEIVQILIMQGADLQATGPDELPLIMAPIVDAYDPCTCQYQEKNAEIFKVLVEQWGVEINTQDARGMTPLLLAAQNNQPQIVKYLLARGVNANQQDPEGNTPLMLAVRNGHGKVVKVLMDHRFLFVFPGVDLNIQNQMGLTALDIAKAGYDTDIVDALSR